MEKKELININVAIPQTMKNLIETFVSMDTHINFSDFVRDAIRQKLQRDAPHLYKQLFEVDKNEKETQNVETKAK
jgi:Arc/MetJ-type ribon-helix-helix transcriptional regulator